MRRIVLAIVIALALVVSLPLCGRVAAQEQRQTDEREPNNERRLADVVGGMSIHGSMSAKGDVDWFVLRGQEGTRPTFTILHAPGNDFDFGGQAHTCSGSPNVSPTIRGGRAIPSRTC